MIYVTGDTHGSIDDFESRKLSKLKKGDSLIICGDFGFLWDNSKNEIKNLKKLSSQKYTILFVEGAHENFDMLESFDYVEIFGAKARKIRDNIYCLARGEIYNIEGKKIFALGGGLAQETLEYDVSPCDSKSMPTDDELEFAVNNLQKNNKTADAIITHEPPASVKRLIKRDEQVNDLNLFLDTLIHNIWYDKWFFGSLHADRQLSKSMWCVWQEIMPL